MTRDHRRASATRPGDLGRPPRLEDTSRPPDPPVEGHVVVLGRQGCHLCDDVVGLCEEVARARPDLMPSPAVVVDVDADPGLRARWGDHVPVTFVDGVLIAYWFLDRDTLLRALQEGPTQVAVIP